MCNVPDFVAQVQDVEKKLITEWQSVHDNWKDRVAEGFNDGVIEPYLHSFQQYITGDGINGLGLEQLLIQMKEHLEDMDSLLYG
jgi:hypothetical protein